MQNTYLNAYHQEREERAKAALSRQRRVSVADAMKQYDRIKHQSTRAREQSGNGAPVGCQSTD